MGADNWAFCPKCARKREAERKAFEKKVRDSYGKVSSGEYLKLTEKLNTPEKVEEEVREEYSIGIDPESEEFIVSYYGHCTHDGCEFSFEFKAREKLKLPK